MHEQSRSTGHQVGVRKEDSFGGTGRATRIGDDWTIEESDKEDHKGTHYLLAKSVGFGNCAIKLGQLIN